LESLAKSFWSLNVLEITLCGLGKYWNNELLTSVRIRNKYVDSQLVINIRCLYICV